MSDPVSRNSMPGLGIDIGSESVKAALVVEGQPPRELLVELAQGQPLRRVKEIFERLLAEPAEAPPSGRRSPVADSSPVAGPRSFRLAVTGSGAGKLCELLGLEVTDEASALAAAFTRLYPDVRTVVEMGRESQKYLLLTRDERSGRLLVEDSSLGNKCAAGSGSFLDHIYRRLNFPSIEEFAEVAYRTDNPASLSGRCGVFTESDIVHLYQKGTSRERIAAGVHHAISRNYRSCFCRGKEFRPKVAFIGGVSRNKGVVKFLSQELGMNGQLFVPERNLTLGAIGAALRAEAVVDLRWALELVEARLAAPLEYPGAAPLRLGRSVILSPPAQGDLPAEIAQAALGVDIGSVSTKAALVAEVDGQLRVLASYYRRTAGDPLAAVRDTLSNIHQQITDANCRIGAVVAGTTGSGRYLTGDYIGADVIKNEITAQAAGATAFAGQLEAIDSILEIGGQDSKYIALNGEVITDFEMNKACAAGCGAFLEKQAAHLGIPIEEFGQTALQAQRPPDLDWTCTVFSESAMLHYQQNSVPRQELAAGTCLASVKNYLAKTVGGREIGSRVVFQGAVAFNHGMVAAFETVLGRQITVPPYPHLTGAIGVARVALRQMPDQPKFRGFEQIAQGCYTVASFECKSCPNRCDVNTFQIEGGPKYFYNDRCEKYSGVHKRDLGQGLPNLFEERERKLFEVYSKQAPPGAGRVGIPRVGMFNDYFPLFSAFFGELGFQVVPSAATSKRIIDLGLRTAVGEPCFPFKVAHGHLAALLEEGVDFLFVPGIHQIEQPNPKLARSHTCPYWQAAPEVLAAALGLQGKVKGESGEVRETAEGSLASHLSPLTSHPVYLRPRLFLDRGPRHLRRVMREVARRLGCSARRADRALEVAVRAQQEFRRWLQERGQQVYQSLPPDATAFVVLGRPYTLHDPAVNMEIGRKIQDLGILAIPADFLPLDQPDITDRWPNMYARQVQKKLAAARLIRADRRLRAVVLTYFGCGPDSFANPFFKDELGQPCFVMQIDEHTADAGMITRLEAFTDTALGAGCGNRDAGCGVGDDTRHTPITASPPSADPSTLHSPLSTPDLRTSPPAPSPSTERGCPKGGGEVVAGPRSPVAAPIPRLAGKKLWIPHASQGAHVLAAALRAYQVDAQVLPRSPDLGLNLARAAISEDVCVPMLYTTEDILRRIEQPDFDPQREAFFQGNSLGPCRFGMYCMMQRQILDKRGLPEVEIFTLGSRSEHGGLGTLFSLVAWDGLVAHDMLEKMLHHTRPYEIPVGGAPGGDQQPATGVDVGTPHPASRIPHPPPLSPVAGCRLPVADSPSERIFQKYLALICDLMKPHRDLVESSRGKWLAARGRHLGALLELVRSAQHEFAAVERAPEPRPLVGLVGEFYVRLHDLSNQGVIRKVEKLGGEVWLAPLTEFFSYANRIAGKQSLDRWRDTLQWADLKDGINKAFLDWLAGRDEHLIFHAALPYLHGFDDIPSKEVIAQGSLYLNPCFGGEAICSLGKSEDFARRGLDGLISVGPFNCMPGNIVTALAPTLRRRHHGIPFLNLDYDGFVDSSRDTKLISFMAQVKERARRL